MYKPGHTPRSPPSLPSRLFGKEKGVGDEAPYLAALQKIMQYIPYKGASIEIQGTGCKVFNQKYSSPEDAKKAIDNSYAIIQRSIK
jgi:hypothetical protein